MTVLVTMLASGKDELICDLAQTYGILDYRALPVRTLAALAYGLDGDSRSKRKMAGMPVKTGTLLLAMAVDALNWLVWSRTKNAQRTGSKPPESIAQGLLHPQKRDKPVAFRTGAEFDMAWAAATKGVG